MLAYGGFEPEAEALPKIRKEVRMILECVLLRLRRYIKKYRTHKIGHKVIKTKVDASHEAFSL